MGKFQIRAKAIFLTYSQSDLSTEQIEQHVRSIKEYQYLIVAQEKHSDGGTHQHALVQYSKPLSIRDCHKFDICGTHPSIEAVRNYAATITYCKKDGAFTEFGLSNDADTGGDGDSGRDLLVRNRESFIEYFSRQHQEGITVL